MRLVVIDGNAHNCSPMAFEFAECIAEHARLFRAARGEVARVKVEDDRALLTKLVEVDDLSFVVGSTEVRCLVSLLNHQSDVERRGRSGQRG